MTVMGELGKEQRQKSDLSRKLLPSHPSNRRNRVLVVLNWSIYMRVSTVLITAGAILSTFARNSAAR